MATPLALKADHGEDGAPRLTASGEIDLSNVRTFSDALSSAIAAAEGNASVTVDMAAVKYLDSAAINVLFTHADQVERLHLIVHPFLIPVLTISGLGEVALVEPAAAADT